MQWDGFNYFPQATPDLLRRQPANALERVVHQVQTRVASYPANEETFKKREKRVGWAERLKPIFLDERGWSSAPKSGENVGMWRAEMKAETAYDTRRWQLQLWACHVPEIERSPDLCCWKRAFIMQLEGRSKFPFPWDAKRNTLLVSRWGATFPPRCQPQLVKCRLSRNSRLSATCTGLARQA